ncbi:hypothetical protein FO519_001281 [Halicephalobus sp. NKZ332]|nr:hypothetical protein FO519_001281 [Halicephalobus sp. NKZ332]
MATASKHPMIYWAQRKATLMLTVAVEDLKIEKLEFKDNTFSFKGSDSSNQIYEANLTLYEKVDPAAMHKADTTRQLEMVIGKVEPNWWPRLLKESTKETMAANSVENESPQSNQAGDTDGSEISQSPPGEPSIAVVTSINELVLAGPENIGNWCDLLENDDTLTFNNGTEVETKQTNKQPADLVPFQHKVAIVLGTDLLLCQLPNSGPYNALVYGLSDNVTEPELYMLFGGPRAIDSYVYRSDLREMLLQFREHHHLVDAMLRQGMQFKEKPLLLAAVLIDQQIDDFHRHNARHRDIDMHCVPLVGAYDKCHERQADGSMMELFDDTGSIDTESISSASQIGSHKRISDDVRYSQNYFQYPSNPLPNNSRSRTESVTSMGSMRSTASRTQRQLSKDQFDPKPSMFHHPPPQNLVRQVPPSTPPTNTPSSAKPKANPFGDAKPVDTNKKVLQVHDRVMAQKQNEQQHKNIPPILPNLSQPPPNFRPQQEINPNVIKIQRRPDGVPPAGVPSNGKIWMNSNIQIPPPPNFRQQQQQPSRSGPNHMNVMDETIDVSKPPPPLPHRQEKQENKKQQRQGSYKNSGHGNQGQQYNKNGFGQGQQQNYQSHQSLPPSGPNSRRKSSNDQGQPISDTLQAEKSQSAPLSQEGSSNPQAVRRDSPSNQSLKRPNSANSSMSFVTALSGSEISSTKSTELTYVPGSMDSIPERLSDVTEEQRRHSWEGRKSPNRRKDPPRKKSGFNKKEKKGSVSGESVRKSSHASDGLSRQSSTSPPQYQSASNVFLDASEGSTSTVKSQPLSKPEKRKSHEAESKPVARAKNSHQEKRAPSLPLSRPHTASNDKESGSSKIEPFKADSLSAPPTPNGPNKKRKEKAKAKTNSQLHNNKFRTLVDCHDIE